MQISIAERHLRVTAERTDLTTSERVKVGLELSWFERRRDRYNERNRKRREKVARGVRAPKRQNFTI